jgi:pilus assembly protein CpaF
MITAMNTGAQGSLSTLHSNRPRDALLRLEGLISLAHPALGSFAIRNQIASAINLVIQVERLPNGSRRVTEVAELTGADDGELQVEPLYRHQVIGVAPDGTLTTQETYGTPSPALAMIARQYGLEPMLGHVMRDAS